MRIAAGALALVAGMFCPALAQAQSGTAPPADESVLGVLPITGTAEEHVTTLAVLPSLSPDRADVDVRSIVRRDLELTGLFKIVPERNAPVGTYGFDDPVDVPEWTKVGAEVIVKAAAKTDSKTGKVTVFGLAYFLNVGKDPVYEKKLVVDKKDIRVTAHRITDALLGALTGRNGGFASHMTFAKKWARNMRVFTMDADGNELKPVSDENHTAIGPAWGPNAELFYSFSKNYAPFKVFRHPNAFPLPFSGSVYGIAFSSDGKRMAAAVSESTGSSIYVGNADGTGFKKVSNTRISTHPVFSPSGKLAWVGGGAGSGPQRVYLDGKAVSPGGFRAAAPAFCDTEDGIRLVYSVAVGGDREDLVTSGEKGGGTVRLTQNQGSNTYPACSPDGRMLAFFSTRRKSKGLYVMSLKRWKTQKVNSQHGQSLRWDPLPPAPKSQMP